MRRDYVGLASIFLRLAMAPDTVVESVDIIVGVKIKPVGMLSRPSPEGL